MGSREIKFKCKYDPVYMKYQKTEGEAANEGKNTDAPYRERSPHG